MWLAPSSLLLPVSLLASAVCAQQVPLAVPSETPPFVHRAISKVTGLNLSTIAKLAGEAVLPSHELITEIDDYNYEAVLSKPDVTWWVYVYANDAPSKIVGDRFNEIAESIQNKTAEFPSNIKLARINFLGKTDQILTRWMVFKAATYVFAGDHGTTLRYIPAPALGSTAEQGINMVNAGLWRNKAPWTGYFSPNDTLSEYLPYVANVFDQYHATTGPIPNWVFMVLSGFMANFVIQFFHRRRP